MKEGIDIANLIQDDPAILAQLTRGGRADEHELGQAVMRSLLRQEALLTEIRDLLTESATKPPKKG